MPVLGSRGLEDAKRISSLVAKGLGTEERLIIPSSTGVIGIPLPLEKIEEGIPKLINALSPDGWMNTVEAIMTTDTFPKVEVVTCRIKGKRVKICGMVKGAGMIRPNLATMLSFLVTDANIKAPLLQQMLEKWQSSPIIGSRSMVRPAPTIPYCYWRMESLVTRR